MKKENDYSDFKGGFMNKYRTLKAVGFFVVLAAVLAFLVLPNSQAGGAKPIKWKATVTGENLIGSGEFVGGVDHVNINNGLGTNDTPCSITGTSGAYSYLELQVFDPSLQFFMNAATFWGPDDLNKALCGFPNTLSSWPNCIADFLNHYLQPTADYPHIILRFTTCGCGNSTTDLMAMDRNGGILPVHMSLLFFSHIWGCPPSSPSTQQTYLNLNMSAHGYKKDVASLPDIYIQRVGDVWTAYVDTAFDNPAYPNLPTGYTSNSAVWPICAHDNILGQYATCGNPITVKGKTTYITTYHYPWAKAPLKFQIAFTKY